MTYLYENEIPTFVSASTVTDIYYILRKDKGHQNTIDFLKNLFDFIEIAGVDKLTIMEALESDISDFEDAVQITVAQQYDCQMILTRNKSDFVNTNLEVYTAEEYGQMIN